jgi:hypothetical protein
VSIDSVDVGTLTTALSANEGIIHFWPIVFAIPYPNEPTWSRSEKAIARALFDAALKRELHEVMQKTV